MIEGGTIHFELPEGLPHSIFCYPVTNLLDIDGTDDFIRECFYKILDRPVDAVSFKKLTFSLRIKKLSRLEVIQEIYNLEERYKKQTDLNYE